jgi:2'-5' RNA ligase
MTWLVPAAGPERDRLSAVIGGLAGEHDTPAFTPHVTLTDPVQGEEMSVLGALQQVLSGREGFEVTLNGFGHEPEYFRSLYLTVPDSEPLTKLNEAAREAFEQVLPAYRPHLSLLYSDLPEESKDAIATGLDLELPITVRFEGVELWADNGPRVPADNAQDVASWHRIARLLFPGPPASPASPAE